MKHLLFPALILAPGLCWSMTEEQAITTWKTSCTAAGGAYFVDLIRTGDAARASHMIYVCEHQDGAQSVRIIPAQSRFSAPKG